MIPKNTLGADAKFLEEVTEREILPLDAHHVEEARDPQTADPKSDTLVKKVRDSLKLLQLPAPTSTLQ